MIRAVFEGRPKLPGLVGGGWGGVIEIWLRGGGPETYLDALPTTAPIELRVEVHHLRCAKKAYLNSQFDRSCL
eukprot:gene24819-biopygen10246